MKVLQRLRHVQGLERIRLGCGERAGPRRYESEPRAGGGDVAGALLDRIHEFRDMRRPRLLPVPFHHPGADARLRRQALERLHLLLRAGQMNLVLQAELRRLLERVQHIVALNQENNDIRIRGLRLDQIGREVDRPERREIAADALSTQGCDGLYHARLERVAERIVWGDIVVLLAVLLDERAGDRVGLRRRRVADAKDVPMAGLAGDRVGVAARDNVQHALLVRHLRHGEGERRVEVAEQEVDLVAVDELARFLHRHAGVAARRILDHELDFTAQYPALLVDLVDGELAADEFVLAGPRVGTGQGVVESDLDRLRGPRGQNEGTGELGGA